MHFFDGTMKLFNPCLWYYEIQIPTTLGDWPLTSSQRTINVFEHNAVGLKREHEELLLWWLEITSAPRRDERRERDCRNHCENLDAAQLRPLAHQQHSVQNHLTLEVYLQLCFTLNKLTGLGVTELLSNELQVSQI